MYLESAKCPNCAADIQVPGDREETFCAYCGSKIKTRAAIGFFQVEVKGVVQIDKKPDVQAKLQRGRETGDFKYFLEALDLDPGCYEAKIGFVEVFFCDEYGARNLYHHMHPDGSGGSAGRYSVYSAVKDNKDFDWRFKRTYSFKGMNPQAEKYFWDLYEVDQFNAIEKAAKNFVMTMDDSRLSIIDAIFAELAEILSLASEEGISKEDKRVTTMQKYVTALYDECSQSNLLIPDTKKRILGKGWKNQRIESIEESVAKIKKLGYL